MRLALLLVLLASPAWSQDYPNELQPLVPPERILAAMGFMALPDEPPAAISDTPVTIDVLYVKPSGQPATCPATSERFNEISGNSAVAGVTLRTVGCRVLAQTSSLSISVDLNRLSSTNDGFYDEVHAWRDETGADMVQMVVPQDVNGAAGVGFINATVLSAFSVVVEQYAVGYMSGPHELGHNYGMRHDLANAGSGSGPFPYSYGWRAQLGAGWRTVMSYAPGDRIPYWSTPLVTCPGTPAEPCGTATADNARVLLMRAATVAQFRLQPTNAPAPPGKPFPFPTLED